MDIEDLPSSLEIRQVDFHNAVEAPRTDEGSVQQVLSVGGSHHYHITVSPKTVHLHQDLVKSIIALVMRSMASTSLPSHSIDLINENYGW